ncbi:Ephrin [Mactra antiquata]
MLKCEWFNNVYKLVLMLAGAWMIIPGAVSSNNIPVVSFNWTRSNERFVQDVGASLSIAVGTNLVIHCPAFIDPPEYYTIYWVSARGFQECFKPANDSKLLVVCNRPNQDLTWIQEVRSFSGVPGGKEFDIGQNYYLATFSTGTLHGLNNEIGGACRDSTMKLNISIVDASPPTTPGPTNHTTPTTKRPVTPPTRKTTQTTETTTTKSTTETSRRTTPRYTTPTSYTTDIPVYTDIPVINVPDSGSGGNTGVIDISRSSQLSPASSLLVLSICLSLVHILYYNRYYIHR